MNLLVIFFKGRRKTKHFQYLHKVSLLFFLVLWIQWDVGGEKKPCCLVGDLETQVDVHIAIICDHSNDFTLYVMH